MIFHLYYEMKEHISKCEDQLHLLTNITDVGAEQRLI
jgi:hypothetical protein